MVKFDLNRIEAETILFDGSKVFHADTNRIEDVTVFAVEKYLPGRTMRLSTPADLGEFGQWSRIWYTLNP